MTVIHECTPSVRWLKIPKMKPLRIHWKVVGVLGGVLLFLLMLYYMHAIQPSCGLGYLTDRSMQHILNYYCNSIEHPMTGEEGLEGADAEKYKLESAHVIVRHGDRFHLHSLPNYHYFNLPCSVDEDIVSVAPVMTDFAHVMSVHSQERKRDQTFFDLPIYPHKQFCRPSDLTPEGATQHVKNGRFLKERYIDKLDLLDKKNYMREILVRSTKGKSRTLQSAVAMMYGFLPQFNIGGLNMEVAGNNSMCTDNMAHACHCPLIVPVVDQMACNYRQMTPEVRNQAKVKQAYQHMATVLNSTAADVPRLSQVMDVTMIHVCHSRKLPRASSSDQCISGWAVRDVYDSVQENGAKQVLTADYQRIAKLKMQPLLHEIAHRMSEQIEGNTEIKFVLYSGHDTTIEPLAAALGFSDGHWPRYASRIVLELYSHREKTSQHSAMIRVLYDGLVVTHQIPFCNSNMVDKRLGLCSLASFREYVDGQYLQSLHGQPKSYTQACEVV